MKVLKLVEVFTKNILDAHEHSHELLQEEQKKKIPSIHDRNVLNLSREG